MANRKKPRTVAEGRRLAVKMLQHFEEYEANAVDGFTWSIQAMHRVQDTGQDNVVLEYFNRCRNDPALLAGFCSVLTDHLGNCEEGGGLYLDVYERLTEREITGKPGPWPTMDEDDRKREEEYDREQAAFRGFMDGINGERRA